ncbi:AMP-binding protein [Dactylosporangium sucinum]|uniref:Long-chain-fatty-acid--CoA ligase n=1 Tax=Dactylosporangium sucinum TaxID=1424081 RepID=A0A917UAB7_9ACTN|nr:AMP-binding protein [Dactylosporangium sucinum]GGM64383.1 long-chain-fatty-acid--CoA ligase [Dactylosporangium sucinum]
MTEPELLARVRHSARHSPGTPLHFVADDGSAESVRLADFLAAAAAQAGRLRAAGLGRGDVVAIRGAGGARSVAEAVVAALTIGCVSVPLVSLLGDGDVDVILGLSGARAFLSDAAVRSRDLRPFLDVVASRGTPPVVGGIGALAADPRYSLAASTAPPAGVDRAEATVQDTAFVLFSSGTTGVPKGVLHSHASVLAEVLDFADQLDLTDGGVMLQPFPLGHIGGLAGLFVSLCLGRELVMLSSWDAATAFDAIDRFGVTATGSAPYFAQTLFEECERRGRGLPTLRTMESGGGFVGRELVLRADALGISLSRGYGSTEHPTACTHHSGDPLAVRAESDGRPLNGSQVRIVDASGADCPAGAAGEVLLRGPEQFTGYLSGDTASFAAGGWFRTGDLGRLDESGYLTITGRLQDIIIRGGENIAVAEVESILMRHPAIEQAAVVAVPDARFGERAHAYVVRAAGVPPIGLDDLRRHFDELKVARFKVPELLTELPTLPRNSLGKVQKHLLRVDGSG